MNSVKISAVILTLNEEKNIGRCIDSIQEVADEILVVDSFSNDQTGEICKTKGARFVQNKFEGFIEQETFATNQATYDYLLILDADEALSGELKKSISEVKLNWKYDAYSYSRLSQYCGKWIYHCGWYPDKKTRLINRKKGNWKGENPHHKFELRQGGKIKHLKGDLFHYAFLSISEHVITANKYSDVAAREVIKKNRNVNFLVHVVLNPFYTFINKYFFKLGVLDGYYGFIICIVSSFANFLKYSKAFQLSRNLKSSQVAIK